MKKNVPLQLPEHAIAHVKHMGTMKRIIATHAVMFAPMTAQVQKLIKGIRVSEAASAFVEFRFIKRNADELRRRPYERQSNHGMSLWRDDALPLDAPMQAHHVTSAKQATMEARLAQHAAGTAVDPNLLITKRPQCTEHQALQRFMDNHDPVADPVSGTLALYTERFPCKACVCVIAQFLARQRGVRLVVLYEYSLFNPADNAMARQMMKSHSPQLTLKALKYKPHRKILWMRKTPAKGKRNHRRLTQNLRIKHAHQAHGAAQRRMTARTPGTGPMHGFRMARHAREIAFDARHPWNPAWNGAAARLVVPPARVIRKFKKRRPRI